MPPLRILELRDTDEVGGPGKTILETARFIDAGVFQMHLGVFQTRLEPADTPFMTAARDYGLPVHPIRGFNQYDPRLIQRTAELVRRLDIDIVHAHEVKSDVIGYLASRLRPVPLVTTLHGWIGNSRKQRTLITLDRRIVRRFDLVIAVSRAILQEALAAGVPGSRVRLLNNAIVIDRYRRSNTKGAFERLLGRAPRRPVLACVGRMSPEKGQADLLHAMGLLAKRGLQMEVMLVGDGPDRQALREQADRLGLAEWVHFTGYLDQPQTVLNEADIFVLPSHTEGMPNAALEALAMDVPVLATDVGGTAEVIIDGETGALVPARNPAALARALEAFLKNPEPWKQLAVRGRRHVEQHFDFQTRTRQLEQMYLELTPGAHA